MKRHIIACIAASILSVIACTTALRAGIYDRPLHISYAISGGIALAESDAQILAALDQAKVTSVNPFLLNVANPKQYATILNALKAKGIAVFAGVGVGAGTVGKEINSQYMHDLADALVPYTDCIRIENTQGWYDWYQDPTQHGGTAMNGQAEIQAFIDYLLSKGFKHIMMNPWPIANGKAIYLKGPESTINQVYCNNNKTTGVVKPAPAGNTNWAFQAKTVSQMAAYDAANAAAGTPTTTTVLVNYESEPQHRSLSWLESQAPGSSIPALNVAATQAETATWKWCPPWTKVYDPMQWGTWNWIAARLSGELAITNQPASQTVAAGDVATFTVGAYGGATPYTYQWSHAGTPIVGATAATLTIAAATPAAAGTYTVTVTDASTATATSETATLTVGAAIPKTTVLIGNATSGATSPYLWTDLISTTSPVATKTFTVQVTDTAGILAGSFDVTLTASCTIGPANLSYYSDAAGSRLCIDQTGTSNNNEDRTINNEEILTLTVSNISLTSSDGGTPELRLASFATWGLQTTSGVETLSLKKNADASLSFSGTGTGNTPPITFVLPASTARLANGDTFTWTSNSLQGNGYCMDLLTFDAVSAAPLSIATQPEAQTVYAGETATFTVAATAGAEPYTYQWFHNGNPVVPTPFDPDTGAPLDPNAAPIITTDGPTLNLDNITAADAGAYTVTVTDAASATVTSAAATLTVNTPTAPPAAPVAASATGLVETGFTANWNAVTGAIGYTLDVSTDPNFATILPDYQDVDIGIDLNYDVTDLNAGTTYYYRVKAYNSVGSSAASNVITVATPGHDPAPIIGTQPANQTVTAGQTATFTVAASGDPAPTYQWQTSTNGGLTWANIDGATNATATNATLSVTTVDTTLNGTQYRCVATNGVSPDATSAAATLTVNPVDNSATATAKQLQTQLQTPGAATVTITGPVDFTLVGGVTVASGKNIVGADSTSTIIGGLTIPATSSDVVITGVNFTGGILAIDGANGVDVSHCTFTDTPVAITGAADIISFSWNKFAGEAGGGSAMTIDGATATTTTIGPAIILDHNYFAEGLTADMPAVTNASVYMFNNYIATPGNATATIAGFGAQILSINNIYQNTHNPLVTQSTGQLRAIGNYMSGNITGTTAPGTDTVFTPAYSQFMNTAGIDAPSAAVLAKRIMVNAGNTAGQNSFTPPASIANADAKITAIVTGAGATVNAAKATASVPVGGGFTLTANAVNFTPSARQWYRDNFPILGATGATYTITDATADTDTGAYSVSLTTPNNEIVFSAAYTVTVGATSGNGNGGGNNSGNSGGGGGGGGATSLWFHALLAALIAGRLYFTRRKHAAS